MLRIELIGGDALVTALRQWTPRLQKEIEASIGRSVLRLQLHIKANKLTGQVLKVQTGTLRRSIDQVVTTSGNSVTGQVDTNVRYGIMHEYGFSGTVQVKAHMREIKQAFGRPLKEPKFVQVRAHSANVNFPERSFLRTALRDLKPDIESDLKASIERAIS